jgi:4-hydroxy-tetrahydrodipicolinate synthase
MPCARDAREWAADSGLHGIGDSLYTPFSGPDGDDIDWDAYRALVRYCVGDLGHAMLWLTSGVGEWWSLTIAERKKLLEVAVEEAGTTAPGTVIQACTAAASAKEALDLTRHAQEHGADICYLQTPPMEVHAGEGVLRYFEYIADRTDIALGMFNSPSSGYVLTAEEMAEIHHRIPAVVAVKEGVQDSTSRSAALHALAPELVIWECDLIVYRAGWLQEGIVGPAQLGTAGYLWETPDNRVYTAYWDLIWEGKLAEAGAFSRESGLDRLQAELGSWFVRYSGRPEYFTHWGEGFKYAASVIGMPMGDYPHSRPPQGILPEEAKAQIRKAYENAGIAQQPVTA